MVRLKVLLILLSLKFFKYFNSTMVRLKVGSENSLALFALFQFHYGSIKSLLAA